MTLEAHNLTVISPGTHSFLDTVPFLQIKELVLGLPYDLSIAFVTSRVAQSLNITHRQKDYIPNTLSFALSESSGEIILCMSAIKKQYKDFDMDLTTYITYLTIHSMLHLVGMHHGSTMDTKEQYFLAQFTSLDVPNETNHRSRH